MGELIKISTNEGNQVVSARELHAFLEVKRDFTTWCKQMFEYGFEEGKDFTPILGKSQGGRPSVEYALTLDTAKEIAMLQRSDKGKQARQYFIEVEKRAKEIAKPLTTLDFLEYNLKLMREQEQRVSAIESKVLAIEAKTATRPDYYTIIGYATINNLSIGLQIASKIGGKAARICKNNGYLMDEVPDPRFGRVRSYPKFVLEQVFNDESIMK